MSRLALALVLVASVGAGLPGNLLAWGQPDHAVLGLHTLQKYGAKFPSFLTDPETRDTFILANYSPDYFVLQGPHYVHLDRNFPIFMIQHAQNSRDLAYAYGWGAHQEEDEVGHGRYITESGLPHLYKELVMGTRLMYQGTDDERAQVRHCSSVWNARLINLASRDYLAKYGSTAANGGAREISEAEANTVGYAFSAYLAGLKVIGWALWYGKLKRHPELFPLSDWRGFQDEAEEQARKWCENPQAFSNATSDIERKQLFQKAFAEGDDAPPKAGPLIQVDSKPTKGRIRDAIHALVANPRKDAGPPMGGHVLMSNPEFLNICDNLVDSAAIQVSESASSDGSTRKVDVDVAENRQVLEDFKKALETPAAARGVWPAFAAEQQSLRDFLKSIVQDALDAKD